MNDDLHIPDDPGTVTNGQIMLVLRTMNSRMAVMVTQNNELSSRIETIEIDQRDMLNAWKAAGTMTKWFVLAGKLAAAAAALWALIALAIRGNTL